MKKYLITPSLLNSWKYFLESEYSSLEDFIKTLKREEIEDTTKFQKGNEFEEYMVNSYPDTLNGCYQVKLYKEIDIDGEKYLIYGKADCIKAGVIFDYKHTSSYDVGKFYGSYQTAIYMNLCPEAYKMQYIICNNFDKDKMLNNWNEDKEILNIFKEEYFRNEITIDLKQEIKHFLNWLKQLDLLEIYKEKWC